MGLSPGGVVIRGFFVGGCPGLVTACEMRCYRDSGLRWIVAVRNHFRGCCVGRGVSTCDACAGFLIELEIEEELQ